MVQTMCSAENLLGCKACEELSLTRSSQADLRSQAPLQQSPQRRRQSPTGHRMDPFQNSDGVKTLMVAVSGPTKLLNASGRPSDVAAPWGLDEIPSLSSLAPVLQQQPQQLKHKEQQQPQPQKEQHELQQQLSKQVAKTAVESIELRVKAEKLHLRDLDYQANFLGSGAGYGQRGALPGVAKAHADGMCSTTRPQVLQECRDKVAGAVAALVKNAALVESTSAAQLKRGQQSSRGPRSAEITSPRRACSVGLLALGSKPVTPKKKPESVRTMESPGKVAGSFSMPSQ